MRALLIFLLVVFSSCGEENSDRFCFAFDERSCLTDPWYADAGPGLTEDEKKDLVKAFFKANGIEVKDITLDPFYYDAVCEACHVCPSGTRFFVASDDITLTDLGELDLLNLEVIDCDSFF